MQTIILLVTLHSLINIYKHKHSWRCNDVSGSSLPYIYISLICITIKSAYEITNDCSYTVYACVLFSFVGKWILVSCNVIYEIIFSCSVLWWFSGMRRTRRDIVSVIWSQLSRHFLLANHKAYWLCPLFGPTCTNELCWIYINREIEKSIESQLDNTIIYSFISRSSQVTTICSHHTVFK